MQSVAIYNFLIVTYIMSVLIYSLIIYDECICNKLSVEHLKFDFFVIIFKRRWHLGFISKFFSFGLLDV